jgi:hypothetical protein
VPHEACRAGRGPAVGLLHPDLLLGFLSAPVHRLRTADATEARRPTALRAAEVRATGTFSPLKTDRGWRVVAGPPVDIRLATIGAEDVIKQAEKFNRRQWVEAGATAKFQRHTPPLNIIGGHRFPNAPQIELTARTGMQSTTPIPDSIDGDGLDIPEFLRRQMPASNPAGTRHRIGAAS